MSFAKDSLIPVFPLKSELVMVAPLKLASVKFEFIKNDALILQPLKLTLTNLLFANDEPAITHPLKSAPVKSELLKSTP